MQTTEHHLSATITEHLQDISQFFPSNTQKKSPVRPGHAGESIIGMIRTVGVLVAVGILMVLGIKYMMGSVEEKAQYKKILVGKSPRVFFWQ